MPDHRTLASADVHEPKWITTATTADAGKIITPSSSTNGISELRRITESDINYADKTKNKFGWNDIADSTYTSGAPLAIGAGVRTLLTNNAAGAQTDTSRLGTIWNVGGSYFQINDLNATYLTRIQMRVKAAAAAGTPYSLKLELETSNGPTVISVSDQFIKGGSYENGVSFTTLTYIGSFINNTQLKIYLTPDTAITVYNIGFTTQRLYKES